MKKLITATVASAFAFFAIGVANGDGINQGADFEAAGFEAGGAFSTALDDNGLESAGDLLWYTSDTDADNVISNYPSTGAEVPIASRPDKFASGSNSKFLKVETAGKLYRTVTDNGGSDDFLTNTVYGHSLAESAIYLDTLVKFTPADAAFADDALSVGDKIAVSYVEHEAETDGDEAYTNFVVRAGLISGSQVLQTNYFANLPDNFDKDAWHRLTVRTIPNVGNEYNSVGFVIYVDETPLAYPVAVDAGFGTLNNATAEGFYNATTHALFPSAIPATGTGGQTITAAAFSGNGSVDDVVFTTTTPGFIKATESVVATITVGTGISSVTVSVAGEPVAPVDATASPLVFNLAPGTTTFTLAVTADSANGYSFNAATGITAENASYDDGTVTISGGAPTLTLKATRNNVTYIDGEDQQQSSSSLATALAAAKAGSTITLAYSVDVADIEGSAFETYDITSGKDLVLDLNGKTITWNDDQGEEALFTVKAGASFRVIDSSVANTGAIVYTGGYAVFYNKGNCYIGATTGDKGPTIQGKLAAKNGEAQIVRGKFDKATNGAVEFTWADYIEEGSELVESLGDYWVVAPQGAPEPVIPTYELTIPEVTGASAAVTSNDVVVADLTAIPSNTAVVVTWTLSEGYKLTAGSLTENITMDSNKTAATPTVAAIDYATLTIESVANCTIVVSNATDEVATGTKFDKADAVQLTVYRTPAEGYELDNCAASETITMDQDQTVTAAVKSAGGGYPSYIPTENAEVKAKYDAWKETYGADTGSAYEDAFLLNIAPDAADQTLEPASITIVDGKIVIEANKDLEAVNGKVYIKTAATLSGLESASWAEATLDKDGAIEMTPNGTGAFFKIKVDF